MSAKDPRRSLYIRMPAPLRGALQAERAKGRSNSAAAALRRMVMGQLAQGGYCDQGIAPGVGTSPYRLQLGRSTCKEVTGIARQTGVTEEYVVLQLIATAQHDAPPDGKD